MSLDAITFGDVMAVFIANQMGELHKATKILLWH